VFCQFAVDNIKQTSLEEACFSPYFKQIRKRQKEMIKTVVPVERLAVELP